MEHSRYVYWNAWKYNAKPLSSVLNIHNWFRFFWFPFLSSVVFFAFEQRIKIRKRKKLIEWTWQDKKKSLSFKNGYSIRTATKTSQHIFDSMASSERGKPEIYCIILLCRFMWWILSCLLLLKSDSFLILIEIFCSFSHSLKSHGIRVEVY